MFKRRTDFIKDAKKQVEAKRAAQANKAKPSPVIDSTSKAKPENKPNPEVRQESSQPKKTSNSRSDRIKDFIQESKDTVEQKRAEHAEEKEQKKAKDYESGKLLVEENYNQAKRDREEGRKSGRAYAEDVLNRQVTGLDPKKRSAMQYEANKGIQRTLQGANRKLLGDQGQRGIVGKGGVGYAQQRDLQRAGVDAQSGVTRDLDKLDSDLSLKKLAAMFNIEQGEASQNQLDRQMALDELHLSNERKRQRGIEDKLNKLFSRI